MEKSGRFKPRKAKRRPGPLARTPSGEGTHAAAFDNHAPDRLRRLSAQACSHRVAAALSPCAGRQAPACSAEDAPLAALRSRCACKSRAGNPCLTACSVAARPFFTPALVCIRRHKRRGNAPSLRRKHSVAAAGGRRVHDFAPDSFCQQRSKQIQRRKANLSSRTDQHQFRSEISHDCHMIRGQLGHPLRRPVRQQPIRHDDATALQGLIVDDYRAAGVSTDLVQADRGIRVEFHRMRRLHCQVWLPV